MICVEHLCVLRAKEKLNEPSTLHACIVLQDSAWSACRSVCEGGGLQGCRPLCSSWLFLGRGGAYGGQGKPVGGGWASLLRGCQLIGP